LRIILPVSYPLNASHSITVDGRMERPFSG